MGQHTKIDWCDATWNPVTGCKHGCPYCYAERIAERFRGCDGEEKPDTRKCIKVGPNLFELDDCQARRQKNGKLVAAPYPYGFSPTLHRYRLDEPKNWKEPKNIFVCSMADLFGAWVPYRWIKEVLDACVAAPWHSYLFLTKNPRRIDGVFGKWRYTNFDVNDKAIPDVRMMFGATATTYKQLEEAYKSAAKWVSIEPIQENVYMDEFGGDDRLVDFGKWVDDRRWDWVVIGAETGNRKDKVIPKREWIDDIVAECDKWETPVFMKESLRELMGPDFRQELPWKD